jgi:hypothetical protein
MTVDRAQNDALTPRDSDIVLILLRISKGLTIDLSALAKQNGRSRNSEIAVILQDHIKAEKEKVAVGKGKGTSQ